MARVRLDNVRKVYDNDFVAVHGASYEVEDGEFVVLVGPSGCGKSTMLRMIAGLESITEGELRIGDRVVNDVAPKDRDIAMVFQNYALYPHMSVYDNMAFGLKLRKYDKKLIDERVQEAAKILSLEGVLDRKPKHLSGGQRQRVAVGRAIVRKPQVFLFDEPLSNLDAKLRVQMRTEISRLHSRLASTMIYVTHDQVEAMTMGDRIVVLKDGHVQQMDTPLNLYDHPRNQFVAGFIGSPSMNFLEGRLTEQGGGGYVFEVVGGNGRLPIHDGLFPQADLARHAGQPLTLGVRPEDFYLRNSPQAPPQTAPLQFTVDVLEPMGNEIVVYASEGSHSVVARVAPQPVPQPDETIHLEADLTRLHLFDPETELALAVEPEGELVTA